MQIMSIRTLLSLGLLTTLIAVTACTTLEYRDVQDDFATAVAADNEWSVSPFGANVSEGLYGNIQANLTADYIADLDPRLQSNAWLLRAVSEWRLDQYEAARNSASKGRQALLDTQKGSRDDVILNMLDGLIVDSELRSRFQSMGKTATLGMYESDFSDDFKTGIDALKRSFQIKGPATPVEVSWYYQYQRWRLLDNWRSVVNSIENDTDRAAARSDAEAKAGGDLRDLMDAARNEIPERHPLRELIRAQGG